MRIGIVNDQPAAVQTLRQAIALTDKQHVIWVAKDGAEALELCAEHRPDMILMELALAGREHGEPTRRIVAKASCPIVIVTDNVDANASRVFEAMACGAIDAIDMPVLDPDNPRERATPLLNKISTVARLVGDIYRPEPSALIRRELVAIGASAGGPSALATVLGALPNDFPVPIVIVQHLDAKFAAGMTDWLNQHSALPVRVAREDDCPAPGSVLLAGTSDHLVLKSCGRLGYTPEPRQCIYRPSIDVFFDSASRLWRGDIIGLLLTGMGRDGALGLKALRNEGHHTIAQDEATSAVYGMPKAAATLGAAVDILPVERIGSRLNDLLSRRN